MDSGTRFFSELIREAGAVPHIIHGAHWLARVERKTGTEDPERTFLLLRSQPFWRRALAKKEPVPWNKNLAERNALPDDSSLQARTVLHILRLVDARGWPWPMVVTYEALVRDPHEVMEDVYMHLGLKRPAKQTAKMLCDGIVDRNRQHLEEYERG